ncbi:hypothetical protein TNCV_4170991 [Trichonephila clavipes]|nr:hypothetical protein TNCV_4170991 [Trichonephila clavipes]
MGGPGPPTFLPLPPSSREDLQLDGYLKYPHAAKARYIYKRPCHFRDSNSGPAVQQSVSLTTTHHERPISPANVMIKFVGSRSYRENDSIHPGRHSTPVPFRSEEQCEDRLEIRYFVDAALIQRFQHPGVAPMDHRAIVLSCLGSIERFPRFAIKTIVLNMR